MKNYFLNIYIYYSSRISQNRHISVSHRQVLVDRTSAEARAHLGHEPEDTSQSCAGILTPKLFTSDQFGLQVYRRPQTKPVRQPEVGMWC